MRRSLFLSFRYAVLAATIALMVGCGSRPLGPAPVEDRGTGASRPTSSAPVVVGDAKQPPGFENAGKPGYYTVKPGDTLIRIGLDTGQNIRDIVRWNSLENPNLIEVGQVLRIVPPTSDNPLVVTRPVTSGTAVTTTAAAPARAASAAPAPASSPSAAATDDDIAWIWPAQGKLIAGFDVEARPDGERDGDLAFAGDCRDHLGKSKI